MTITQILDKVLPITKEENRCGFKKAAKLNQRAALSELIYQYRNGVNVILPPHVKALVDQ